MKLEERINYLTTTAGGILPDPNEAADLQKQIQARSSSRRRSSMQQQAAPNPRFVVRKGTVEGSWMVWDRATQRPAYSDKGRIAAGLTEEQARSIRDQLDTDIS
jgi:hypothetical protein